MYPETQLIMTLVERFGLIIAAAFLFLLFSPGTNFAGRGNRVEDSSLGTKIAYIIFFSAFGILGTYGGDTVFNSYANLRAMSVITAGLVGGPLVGGMSGLIAGGHRFLIDIGGFSAVPCGLATFLEGLVAGVLCSKLKDPLDWRVAFGIAAFGESMHMILVLALSTPFPEAIALVRKISVPMITVNSVGAAFFVRAVKFVTEYRQRQDSSQVNRILDIASRTVSHLRGGLNHKSAEETARIIHETMHPAAVSITDTVRALAHVGVGSDHHKAGQLLMTEATPRVLEQGIPVFLRSAEEIACHHPSCPFTSAIIVPLKKGETIVGSLKFYGTRENKLNFIHFEMAKGLADLFCTQLELEDIQLKAQLLADAEIRALQAQINPHFLFNSLSTVASFCRTDPGRARELILNLSSYMRRNFTEREDFIPLDQELEQVEAYLAIEQARFGDRIKVEMDIDQDALHWPIPPLIIQPLVENGVKHGIAGKEDGGTIRLRAHRENGYLRVCVDDDGVGMAPARLEQVLMDGKRDSIGLKNCVERMERIYGPRHAVRAHSAEGMGTSITFTVPETSLSE